MSSLLSWKKACLSKIRQKRDTTRRIRESQTSYQVPDGWKQILSDSKAPGYFWGVHHRYLGIHINRQTQADVFASRDVILSLLFSSGRALTDGITDPNPAWSIIDLFCDIGGWKSTENIEGHTYLYLRSGLFHMKQNFMTVSSSVACETLYRKFPVGSPGVLGPEEISNLWTVFIQAPSSIPYNDLSHNQIDNLILILTLLELPYAKYDLEVSLLSFMMSLIKGDNVADTYVTTRFNSFRKICAQTDGMMDIPTPSIISETWKIISYHLEAGSTTIEFILENLTKVIENIDNVVLKPMPSFLAYRGLTPIVNVAKAINDFPTFPWNSLIKNNSTIKAEFKKFREILRVSEGDVLLGYKCSGAGSVVPNLCYLATVLLIDVGGVETLKTYRGIGPNNKSRVSMCNFLDSLIEGYKNDVANNEGAYQRLKDAEAKLRNVLSRSGLTDLMSKFLSHESPDDDDSDLDEPDNDPFKFTDDDDSDDDDPRPGPSSRKRIRSKDDVDGSSDVKPQKKKAPRGDSTKKPHKPDGGDSTYVSPEVKIRDQATGSTSSDSFSEAPLESMLPEPLTSPTPRQSPGRELPAAALQTSLTYESYAFPLNENLRGSETISTERRLERFNQYLSEISSKTGYWVRINLQDAIVIINPVFRISFRGIDYSLKSLRPAADIVKMIQRTVSGRSPADKLSVDKDWGSLLENPKVFVTRLIQGQSSLDNELSFDIFHNGHLSSVKGKK